MAVSEVQKRNPHTNTFHVFLTSHWLNLITRPNPKLRHVEVYPTSNERNCNYIAKGGFRVGQELRK
jgi:hypothetical protein